MFTHKHFRCFGYVCVKSSTLRIFRFVKVKPYIQAERHSTNSFYLKLPNLNLTHNKCTLLKIQLTIANIALSVIAASQV